MKKKKRNINKIKIITSLTLVFFIIIFAIYFYYIDQINKQMGEILGEKSQLFNCQITRKLDGLCVQKGQQNLWPVAIMIDNHPDCWPQFGLSQAQLVYNTLVEGGSTRLMAVFSTHKNIEKIGPVRSARPYYLTWAKELNALYGHSGGSPESLEKIKEYEILDWEESSTYGPLYFWRDDSYPSPHNLFTSNHNLAQARIDWELFDKIPNYTPWQFDQHASSQPKADPPRAETLDIAKTVYVDYSLGVLFDIEYKYNATTKTYLRFQNNAPQIDDLNNRQISVKNLIIQFVPEEEHLDAIDRLAIDTLGQGPAWVFYNGQMIKGQWIKNSLEHRTMFYNNDGTQIIFAPGNIWVEVVPREREVTIQE